MQTTLHQQRPAWNPNRLVFVFILSLISNYMMAASPTPPQDSLQRNFTVAKVYLEKYSDPGTVKVTFYESARFYKIEKSNPKFNEMVRRLKEAIKKRKVVLVTLNSREGNVIERVE